MIRNYLKIAWRTIMRNKLLSCINLLGLSIGIVSLLLIGLYIYQEMSYDRFQLHRDRLFRMGFTTINEGKTEESSTFVAAFAPDAYAELPGIANFCRVSEGHEAIITAHEHPFKASSLVYADSSFFNLFSFHLQQGDAATALSRPFSIVLTPALARQFFGNEPAVGQVLRLDNNFLYTVTGVTDPAPANSQLQYHAVLSLSSLYMDPAHYFMGWNGGNQYITYLLLSQKETAPALQQKLPDFMWRHINQDYATANMKIEASLQPLTSVHLWHETDSGNTRTNLYVFGLIGLLIMVITSVNYINLASAQAVSRFKEVGVRKVLGAAPRQLIRQFIGESVFLTALSFLIALLMLYCLKAAYGQFTGSPLSLWSGNAVAVLLVTTVVVLWLGVGAGSYLAFYLSSLQVQHIFRSMVPKTRHTVLKKAMIVGQFIISIGLLTCTQIIYSQMTYLKNKPLGYDKDHLIVMPLPDGNTQSGAGLLAQQIGQIPGVEHVTALSQVPGGGINRNGFMPEGSSAAMIIHQLDGDDQLLNTLGLQLTAGRSFSANRPADKEGYLINETLARTLNWEQPLGKKIARDGNHEVIGVVKDFSFAPLRDKVEPLIITNQPWQDRYAYLAIRYNAAVNPSSVLDHLQALWQQQVKNAPFDYWFQDEAFDRIYQKEYRFQQLFFAFSSISILLSLAGVFGLVTLFIRQRIREFGIRRVFGAGFTHISWLTARGFLQLIGLSSLIAIPIAWYCMKRWLNNFAFQVPLSWWLFATAGLLVAGIALSSICLQVLHSMRHKPIRNLNNQ